MTSLPFDLPTLRKHYNYYTINQKQIPILYRLKDGIYYPYVAYELVLNELDASCSSWKSSEKLPLLPMTVNERLLYKQLCANCDFSSSSGLILCSIIDQFLQLIDFLKHSKQVPTKNHRLNFCARFTIDTKHGSIPEIDIFNSEATTQYNHLRSTIFPSLRTVKRQLCLDNDTIDLASIGGYLQLDRCIYPYIISSSDILLNLNDLRKPFSSTLHLLLPYFHSQPKISIDNYIKIVEYGTRCIKKYKYYYKNVDEKFISLHDLLICHKPFIFVQLFNSKKISLENLHEYYRSDFSILLEKNIANIGYLNNYPYINGWSLYDSNVDNENLCRLAMQDETILINWLLIYNNKCLQVHHQVNDIILVKQHITVTKGKITLIENKHIQQRILLQRNSAT